MILTNAPYVLRYKPLAIYGKWDQKPWNAFNTIHFNLTSNTKLWPDLMKQVEHVWASVYPEDEVTVKFMDETIKEFYNKERRTVQLLKWATRLAIVISCLGLLGLAVYTTERRVKEIGVRKVLGASTLQINVLLSKEFLYLVGIAFVIATPITWYMIGQWMQDFVYKTTVSWWIFVIGGLGMLLVTLMVVGLRVFKTATANPVKSLRSE